MLPAYFQVRNLRIQGQSLEYFQSQRVCALGFFHFLPLNIYRVTHQFLQIVIGSVRDCMVVFQQKMENGMQ